MIDERKIERLIDAAIDACAALKEVVSRRVLEDVEEIKGVVIRAGYEHKDNVRRLEALEDAREHTDNIYLGDMQKKLASNDESSKHWIRYVVSTGVALVISVGSILIGFFAHHP
jgi:hypothetical protein